MKNIFFLFSFIYLYVLGITKVYGQVTFDTVYLSINFENDLDSIIIFSSDTAGTSWQIGQPSKLNFNEAISPTRAILTDTVNFVQPNTNTWFEVPFIPGNYDSVSFYGFCPLQICFIHRLEKPSSLEAAAWIDIRDNDEEYNVGDSFNFANGFQGNYYGYNGLYAENSYLSWETSFNGEPGFSTPMLETETCYQFWGISSAPSMSGIHDTVYFRFNFATTPSSNPIWEGWLIDDIRIGRGIGWTCFSEGFNEEDQSQIILYPNPTFDNIQLELINSQDITGYKISNTQGQIVCQSNQKGQNTLIELKEIPPGIYFLHLDNSLIVKKFVKQ